MKRFLFVVMVFFMGCGTTTVTSGPPFSSWDTGEPRRYVKVEFTNTNSFAPSTVNSILLECKNFTSAANMSDDERLKKSQCRSSDDGNFVAGEGVLPGLIGAGAIVGGAYFIGKGIEGSGDETTNKTTLDNNASSAADAHSNADSYSRSEAEADADADADSDPRFY